MKKLKKSLSLLLALVMVFSCMSVGAMADGEWGSNYDTQDSFTISSLAELEAFRGMVNSGKTFEDKTVKLMANIDLTSTWTPIGSVVVRAEIDEYGLPTADTAIAAFKGTFDGNGNTITGLTATGENGVGLFGATDGATIMNLIINGASVTGNDFLGTIVGYAKHTTVQGCTVQGAITINGAHFVGGAVGYSVGTLGQRSQISSVSVTASGTIKAQAEGDDGDDVGGLVGFVNYTDIAGCSVNAAGLTISAERQVGGLVGLMNLASSVSSSSVDGVTVKAIYDDSGNLAKLTFGGIVGASAQQYNTIGGTTVSNVTIKFAANVVTDQIRFGVVSAGKYLSTGAVTTLPTYSNITVGEGNTVEIANAGQLKAFANMVNAGDDFAGVTVKLTANIDLEDAEWTPIGYGAQDGRIEASPGSPDKTYTWKLFSGTFDGNTKMISNLKVTAAHEGSGLFGAVENATIKKLTVNNVTIAEDAGDCIGAIAGYAYNSTIQDSAVTGTIDMAGNHYVGGAVGYAASTTLTNVDVTGSGAANSTIAAIDVNNTGADGDDAGGAVGFAVNGTTISDCDVKDVKVSAARQGGGLLGFLNHTNSRNISVNGTVTDVTVEAATNEAVFTSGNVNKVAFGGLVGSMTGAGNSDTISGTVTRVALTTTVTSGNLDKVRLGFITGGKYKEENFIAGGANVENVTVINCTKVSGTKEIMAGHESAIDGNNIVTPVSDARVFAAQGFLADYFVLNVYVRSSNTPNFNVSRSYDSLSLESVTTKNAFCTADRAVYLSAYLAPGEANVLGLTNDTDETCYMVSIKFFTKYLDQAVQLYDGESMLLNRSFTQVIGMQYSTLANALADAAAATRAMNTQ